jgi:drug/metabolite transporter (DMT)-like permease
MELWFIAALFAAIIGGISNFFFKVAAKKGHSSELFMLVSGLCSVVLVGLALLVFPEPLLESKILAIVVFIAGFAAAFAGIMKVYALRYIDSTIYFPLLKLLAPALTIAAGTALFGEIFSPLEWFGMLIGLTVPLLLINRSENLRQSNLTLGLIFVLVTSLISAAVAIINNYAIDAGLPILTVLFFTVLGVFSGSVSSFVLKHGVRGLNASFKQHYSQELLQAAVFRSAGAVVSVGLINYAYTVGGTLSVVQVIYSMYILVTVVLAIIFFKEHWNLQKALAIVLSVVSLAFLG